MSVRITQKIGISCARYLDQSMSITPSNAVPFTPALSLLCRRPIAYRCLRRFMDGVIFPHDWGVVLIASPTKLGAIRYGSALWILLLNEAPMTFDANDRPLRSTQTVNMCDRCLLLGEHQRRGRSRHAFCECTSSSGLAVTSQTLETRTSCPIFL